jgi:hypothetical protein
MAKAKVNKTYATFVKGRITEAGPLTFPENAMTDENNINLFTQGNIKRRLGFNPENNFSLSSQTVLKTLWQNYAIHTSNWNTVGGDGNVNFLVLQIGPTLYFYDQATTPLSDQQKSFTIDLEDFAAPGATDIGNKIVQTASGKGLLFVVGEKIESFYIEYDSGTDDITTTTINIEIRDFEGVDDGLDPNEEPSTLTKEHSYNLKNQGWLSPGSGVNDPTTDYFSARSVYPPNSKQWWQAKDGSDNFDSNLLRKFSGGNTVAPRGHYILKAFYQDRSNVSGVANLPVNSVSSRPRSVSFFAGRVFYAGVSGSGVNGNVYFSQIISEDNRNVGYCYQQNDPTSEDLSDLLASDGGIIVIPEAGTILQLFPMKSALLVLADNGVWSIQGGSNGFRATEFSVSKVSSIGIDGSQSVIDVEGVPIWWGKTGINTISQNEVTDRFNAVSLSKETIQTFYDDIPAISKVDAKGQYDQSTKKIFWLYRSEGQIADEDRYRFDSILVFDTRLGSFYHWTISTLASNPYYVGSIFAESTLNTLRDTVNVVDGSNNVKSSTNQVVSESSFTVGSDTFINYLCFKEGATTVQWSFGNFTSTSFMDWKAVDNTGVDYDSYFETGNELMGDAQRNKQATWVHTYFNRTENEYLDESLEAFDRPSSCYMQAKWEWTDHSNSGKFSPKVQVYKLDRRGITYEPSSGTEFNSGYPVIVTKNKIRGTGKCLRLRFESEQGKDFDLLGWAINWTGVTEV